MNIQPGSSFVCRRNGDVIMVLRVYDADAVTFPAGSKTRKLVDYVVAQTLNIHIEYFDTMIAIASINSDWDPIVLD